MFLKFEIVTNSWYQNGMYQIQHKRKCTKQIFTYKKYIFFNHKLIIIFKVTFYFMLVEKWYFSTFVFIWLNILYALNKLFLGYLFIISLIQMNEFYLYYEPIKRHSWSVNKTKNCTDWYRRSYSHYTYLLKSINSS